VRTGCGQVRRALFFGLLLVVLTGAVSNRWWPVTLDAAAARDLPGRKASGVAGVWLSLSLMVADVATPAVTFLVTAVGAALLARGRHDLGLARVAARLVLLTASVLGGKALLSRPGPPGSQFHGVFGYYPSGHTATAMVCAVTLAGIGAQRRPDWRGRLLAASASWTVLVGASMVFHRFHWLSDVFAALLLGAVILLAVPLAGQRLGRDWSPERATST